MHPRNSDVDIVSDTEINIQMSDNVNVHLSAPVGHIEWKYLDRNAFGSALREEPKKIVCHSPLFSSSLDLDALSITQLFEHFSSTMIKILDEMLPARPAKSRIRLTVWFDRDCYQLRRRTRCLERRYRRSRDTTIIQVICLSIIIMYKYIG